MPTVRFHIKVLRQPDVALSTMQSSMSSAYGAAGINVFVASTAVLDMPNAALFADVAVDCRRGNSSAEQRQLFGDGQANWSGWVPLGGPPGGFQDAPAAFSRQDGSDNVYVRGSDNLLWQRAWYSNSWHDWEAHRDGGVLASRPAISSLNADHEQVFVRGTDGAVWQKWWTRAGGWSGWVSHGAPPVGFQGAPATVARNSAVTNVYVRGGDNALWQKGWFDGAWHEWQRHDDGGVLMSEPAVDSMNRDHEHVFVRGTDGAVWQKWWTQADGWSGWVSHGAPPGGYQGAPSTIARAADVANVYVRGTDNRLWQKAWFNSTWTDWQLHYSDGVLASEPSPDSMNRDHEHVFVRGTDNMLWQKWWLWPQRSREIVVFFVGSVTNTDGSTPNGCASFPSGMPGAVIASYATRWTLAHEVGHVFGLDHVSGENCASTSFVPTALMTGCGTRRLTTATPTLSRSEASTVTGNSLIYP